MSWLKRVFSGETVVTEKECPEERNDFGEEPSGVHQMAIDHIDSTIDNLKDFRTKLAEDLAQIRRGQLKVVDGGKDE